MSKVRNIVIDCELDSKLREQSVKEGRSVSEIIRQAIVELLEKKGVWDH